MAALVGCEKDAPPSTTPAPAAARVKAPAEVREEPAKPAFALYLLRDSTVSGAAAARVPLDDLRLQAAPLLTIDDVVAYDWDAHILALTEPAANRLPQRVETHGTPFVIVVAEQRIYLGAFWTSMSSQSFDHPVIDIDRRHDGPSIPFTFAIEPAYPSGPAADADDDPRNDDRLWNALLDADKLDKVPTGQAGDGDAVVRWLDDQLYFRGNDGEWRAIPRPAAAYTGYSEPQVARAGSYVTIALPQPDRAGHPLVEFLSTKDEGRRWTATVAVASMESGSIEPGSVDLSVTKRGRIHAVVEWSQGRECGVTYSSVFEGKVSAAQLTLVSESEI